MVYKVVLIFDLVEGMADEELKRSQEENSFPNLLAQQPGFVSYELVKINESKTLSIQTWATEQAWWAALGAAREQSERIANDPARENILVSRDFLGGWVQAQRSPTTASV